MERNGQKEIVSLRLKNTPNKERLLFKVFTAKYLTPFFVPFYYIGRVQDFTLFLTNGLFFSEAQIVAISGQ